VRVAVVPAGVQSPEFLRSLNPLYSALLLYLAEAQRDVQNLFLCLRLAQLVMNCSLYALTPITSLSSEYRPTTAFQARRRLRKLEIGRIGAVEGCNNCARYLDFDNARRRGLRVIAVTPFLWRVRWISRRVKPLLRTGVYCRKKPQALLGNTYVGDRVDAETIELYPLSQRRRF